MDLKDAGNITLMKRQREHLKLPLPSLEEPWTVSMFSSRGNEASSCGLGLEISGLQPAAQGAKERTRKRVLMRSQKDWPRFPR